MDISLGDRGTQRRDRHPTPASTDGAGSVKSTCVSSAIVASRNHGKSLNGTNRSRPSTRSQKPDGDTFATSTAEVPCPRCTDFISMLLDDLAGCIDASPPEPIVPR